MKPKFDLLEFGDGGLGTMFHITQAAPDEFGRPMKECYFILDPESLDLYDAWGDIHPDRKIIIKRYLECYVRFPPSNNPTARRVVVLCGYNGSTDTPFLREIYAIANELADAQKQIAMLKRKLALSEQRRFKAGTQFEEQIRDARNIMEIARGHYIPNESDNTNMKPNPRPSIPSAEELEVSS